MLIAECLRLRVQNVSFDRNEITVHGGQFGDLGRMRFHSGSGRKLPWASAGGPGGGIEARLALARIHRLGHLKSRYLVGVLILGAFLFAIITAPARSSGKTLVDTKTDASNTLNVLSVLKISGDHSE